MIGRCSGRTSSAVSGDGGASSRSTPESCLTMTWRMSSASIDGAVTMSTMLFRSSPRSRKTRWSPNCRLPSTRATLRPSSRWRAMAALIAIVVVPDAALRAVEREDAAHRRPGEQRVARREAGQQALDPGQQLGRVERLDEVVVRAGAQPPDLLLHLALGREHDDRDVRRAALFAADLGRDLVAVELGQHDVEQDEIGRLGAPQAEALGAVPGDDDVVALLLERVLQEALDIRVVIDDEDLCGHQSSTAGARAVGAPAGAPRRGDYRAGPRPHRIVAAPATERKTQEVRDPPLVVIAARRHDRRCGPRPGRPSARPPVRRARPAAGRRRSARSCRPRRG